MSKQPFFRGTLLLTGCLILFSTANAAEDDGAKEATHVDSGTIKVAGINAFAVNKDGQILAACGSGPGQVKVLDHGGKVIRSWNVDVKPEAINATPEGDVLVAGQGKLMRFDIHGNLLDAAESPHATKIKNSTDKIRETAISALKRTSSPSTIASYQRVVKLLEERKKQRELKASEERALKLYSDRIKSAKTAKEPTEQQIQTRMNVITRSKMRVASISTDGDQVYIATLAMVGYGFDVWKMDSDFSGGQQIVTGLRGCCGQMDVQCCKNGLYVAENARHRVVCFGTDGKEKLSWGKRDRNGVDGFSSCCNPMNVCFNPSGDVFTAESSTGFIKRFTKDGKLLSHVGKVKLVPGCKNVSIAVSPDNEQVYMLDITRGHIVVMTQKPAADVAANSDT